MTEIPNQVGWYILIWSQEKSQKRLYPFQPPCNIERRQESVSDESELTSAMNGLTMTSYYSLQAFTGL